MSVPGLEKGFSKPLLRKLDEEARRSVVKQKGQLLILADTKELEKVIKMAAPDAKPTATQLQSALVKAQQHARRLQSSFKSRNKRRYNAIIAKLPSISSIDINDIGDTVFIVTSFRSSITRIKNTLIKSLVDEGVLTKGQGTEVSKNLHKGHGKDGAAVSQVQIARSVSDLDDTTKKILLHNLEASAGQAGLEDIDAAFEIEKLVTNARQIVTKGGKLAADYVSIISFQAGPGEEGNIADAVGEKALKRVWRDHIKSVQEDLINMPGSSTLKQKAEKAVLDKFEGKKKLKTKRANKSAKLSTKTNSSTVQKAKKVVAPIKKGNLKRAARKKVNPNAAFSPLAMIGMLNKQLPDTVRKNMKSPQLVNRTGRFADSVKITEVAETPQGYPSFGYTYRKDPYQVFEEGMGSAPWANGERDPRELIEGSIREIAQQMAIGRFYTRRV